MRIERQTLTVVLMAIMGIGTSACSGDRTTTTERTRHLNDSDNDGLLEEVVVEANPADGDGPIIMPEPGNCPVMEWRETHTVKVDDSGNVISESYQVCTQCYEEDGQTPIGDEQCYEEPPIPPDVYCEEYPSMDPNTVCYRCVAADGTVVEDSCYDLPVPCTSDAECPAGQVCYTFENDPMQPPKDPNDPSYPGDPGQIGGYCGYPDPCQPVPTLPSDPTGESCWVCTDPVTGEDFGSWCDVHTCDASGGCVNPWEQCNQDTGYCEWVDPCQPVPSIPEDPTGQDCYVCTYPDKDPMDPSGGGQNGDGTVTTGWCNVHTCSSDADCAATGEVCNEETGYCEWQDPCQPVPGDPMDPNAPQCWECVDPMTGEAWGWCDVPGGGGGCGDDGSGGGGGMEPVPPPDGSDPGDPMQPWPFKG
jgi:Cys-rich repeat protein